MVRLTIEARVYFERLTHFARARAEVSLVDLASSALDLVHSPERLQRPDQGCSWGAFRLCDEIE